ncbi:MAG: glycosyltransferase, partial [Pseudomonadota bacterium]
WVRSPLLPFDPRYHLFQRAKPIHEILDEIRPDIVEGSSTWRGGWIAAGWRGDATKALFLHQDPVAVYPHSLMSPPLDEKRVDQICFWFWWYLRRLSNRFDATAVSGDWFAQRLARFGVKRPIVSSFGVDKSLFSHRYRSNALRRDMLAACGVAPDAPGADDAVLFIAVSRHHMEKRLDAMMDAFARYRRERPAGLFIIGDGPARDKVEQKAAQIEGVRVAGHIGDREKLAKTLASADYMIHGGAAETFGLVVAEALCSGLPIVTPDIGGAADLAHPAYAEVYRPGDVDGFHQALKRITARDRESLAVAARAGANRICEPRGHFRSLLAQYAEIRQENRALAAAPATSRQPAAN